MIWKYILVGVIGYLLGNISTGVIISRLIAKEDVRKQGSGNAGTTNMFRMLGMKASLLTMVGDMLKAVLASLIGIWVAGEVGGLVGGLLAVAGHNWPVFLGFKGGKGIAATAGTMFVNQPILALILVPLAILSIRIIGIVSVVSLCGVTLYMVLTLIFSWGNWPMCVFAVLLWAMAFYSHRANIVRILNGTEKNNRLNFKK